ncbi:MAG TPA: hypothetical protein RMG48_18235 [Myxococcales bacterium LLY-WYZ-16_1]|nr:hypothetical protein [Myxococcales bacterium LLY-WYZ-16_1]
MIRNRRKFVLWARVVLVMAMGPVLTALTPCEPEGLSFVVFLNDIERDQYDETLPPLSIVSMARVIYEDPAQGCGENEPCDEAYDITFRGASETISIAGTCTGGPYTAHVGDLVDGQVRVRTDLKMGSGQFCFQWVSRDRRLSTPLLLTAEEQLELLDATPPVRVSSRLVEGPTLLGQANASASEPQSSPATNSMRPAT